MSFSMPNLPTPPAAPAPPPMFGANLGMTKKAQKPMTPSFLGTETMAQGGQVGNHTLLGQ